MISRYVLCSLIDDVKSDAELTGSDDQVFNGACDTREKAGIWYIRAECRLV